MWASARNAKCNDASWSVANRNCSAIVSAVCYLFWILLDMFVTISVLLEDIKRNRITSNIGQWENFRGRFLNALHVSSTEST